MARPEQRGKRRLVIGLLAGLIGLPLLSLLVADLKLAREVRATRAELKALGLPTTIQDLYDLEDAPADQDAAPLYAKAKELMDRLPREESGQRATLKGRRNLAVSFAPLYAIAHSASRMPACSRDIEWELGTEAYTFQTSTIFGLAKACLLVGDVAAHDGDADRAIEALDVGFKLMEHARNPNISGHMAASNIERRCHELLAVIIAKHGHRPNVAAKLGTLLDNLQLPPSAFEPVKAATVACITQLGRQRDGKSTFDGCTMDENRELFKRIYLSSNTGFNACQLRLLRYYRQVFQSGATDPVAEHAVLVQLDKDVEADKSLVGSIVSDSYPMWQYHARAVVENVNRRKMARLALELKLNGRGSVPAEVAAWDEWTGAPFTLIKHSDGFTLRSFGLNKVDDGGPKDPTGRRTDDVDYVIRDGLRRS